MPIDRQHARVAVRVERTACSTLIPIARDEILFEVAPLWPARAPIKPQEDGGGPISPVSFHDSDEPSETTRSDR